MVAMAVAEEEGNSSMYQKMRRKDGFISSFLF